MSASSEKDPRNHNRDKELNVVGPDKQLVPFRGVDVTLPQGFEAKHLFGMSRVLLAEEYTRFHKDYNPSEHNNGLLHQDILDMIVADKFTTSPRSRTKVSVDPASRFKGTLRFTHGSSLTPHPVETMNIFTPTPGVEWPHRHDGLTDDQIGEAGRIAVMPEERVQGNTGGVLKSLFDETFRDAQENGILQIYIVTPTAKNRTQLRDRISELGIELEPVEGLRLRTEDKDVSDVVHTFSNYWFALEPRVDRIRVPKSA